MKKRKIEPAKAQAYLLMLLLIGFPIISSITPFVTQDNRLISVPYRALICLASLPFLWTGFKVVSKLSKLDQTLISVFGGIWGIYIMRLFYDIYVMEVPTTIDTTQYALYTLFICVIPALAFLKPIPDALEKYLAWLIVGYGTFAGGLLLMAVNSLSESDAAYLVGTGRLAAGTANPIGIGYLAVGICTAMIFLVVSDEPRKSVRIGTRLLAVPVIVLSLFLLGGSASKGPILSLLVGIATIFIGAWFSQTGDRVKRRRWIALGSLITPALLVVTLIVSEFAFGFKSFSRFTTAFGSEDSANATGTLRINFFEEALDHFWKNPFFGRSIFVNGDIPYPHNVFVECLMVGGILLLAFYVVFMAFCLFSSFQQVTRGRLSLITALFYVYFWQSLTSGSLSNSFELWGLAIAALAGARWPSPEFTSINATAKILEPAS